MRAAGGHDHVTGYGSGAAYGTGGGCGVVAQRSLVQVARGKYFSFHFEIDGIHRSSASSHVIVRLQPHNSISIGDPVIIVKSEVVSKNCSCYSGGHLASILC